MLQSKKRGTTKGQKRDTPAEKTKGRGNKRPTKKKAEEPTEPKPRLAEPLSAASYAFSEQLHVADPTDGAALKQTLATYGVAIVPALLSAEECDAFEKGVWDTLGTLSSKWDVPVSKDNPASWVGLLDLMPQHSMLFQQFGLGHAEFVWALRQNPKVVDVFSRIWGVPPEDLLVSFDGIAVHMPPEVTGRGAFRTSWYHTDQRFSKGKLECIQGWATAREVKPCDATLTVLLGSHVHHTEFAQRFDRMGVKGDWYKLANQAEQDFFVVEKGCRPISIACPAGSLVLWDSRTMHAGQESLRERKAADVTMRMVVYLCYLPRSLATSADLEKKREAYNNLRMTSHWPHHPMLFGLTPRTYGKKLPEVTELPKPGNLTKLGRRLAGFP